MSKPIVAIVGRPNVGKSTLFNRLCGERIAIVEDTPGVTRDRIYCDAEWLNHKYMLIDTGGIEPESEDIILSQMREQAEVAIATSDVVIFIVDGKSGMTQSDLEIANILRKSKKNILLVVNKIDNATLEQNKYEFYNLGLGEPIPISASLGLGTGDMLDVLISNFKDIENKDDEDEKLIKVAIIGRPNVGKSSLLNRVTGESRSIVSDIPGTTRDAINSYAEINGDKFMFIDTAGIRRKSKVKEDIERYSVMRAFTSIERADVCVLMIDGIEGPSEQEEKIVGYAHESGKSIIIAVNKWDAVEDKDDNINQFTNVIRDNMAFISYAPIIFISAKTGQRVDKLIELIKNVNAERNKRIKTGILNDVLSNSIMMKQPPVERGKRLKIYYVSQVAVAPPAFVFSVNDSTIIHFSYERYLENQIRQNFGFEGTPVKLIFREKKEM